jgi:hypothetical protein
MPDTSIASRLLRVYMRSGGDRTRARQTRLRPESRHPSSAQAAWAADPDSRLGIVCLLKAAEAFIAGKKAPKKPKLTRLRSWPSMRRRVPILPPAPDRAKVPSTPHP